MVTLVCFCCGHGNPIGARFCNACGASLNLKPCKACEAINGRAAAHCHRCGETFALNFASTEDLVPQPDSGALAEDSATPGRLDGRAVGPWHRLAAVRLAVVAVGMTATVMLSGYYVHRQSESADDAAEGGVETVSRTVSVPAIERAGTSAEVTGHTSVSPAVLPALAGPSGVGAAMPAGEQPVSTRPDANAQGDVTPHAPKVSSEGPRPQAARPAAQSRTTARAQRPAPLPAGRSHDYAQRKAPDAGQRSRQQRVAAARARPPAEPSRISTQAATPVWASSTPQCSEGVAPDSNCDVRLMAKGN